MRMYVIVICMADYQMLMEGSFLKFLLLLPVVIVLLCQCSKALQTLFLKFPSPVLTAIHDFLVMKILYLMVYILLSISIRDLLVMQTLTVVDLTMRSEGVVHCVQVSFSIDFVHSIQVMLTPWSYLWDMVLECVYAGMTVNIIVLKF